MTDRRRFLAAVPAIARDAPRPAWPASAERVAVASDRRHPASPAEAIARLEEGNAAFPAGAADLQAVAGATGKLAAPMPTGRSDGLGRLAAGRKFVMAAATHDVARPRFRSFA
jgi:hypothetical protein